MICVLEQELLSGLVGIHGAILEHRVHIVVRVLLAGDLLDVLDDLPHVGRDRNPRGAAAAAAPAAAAAAAAAEDAGRGQGLALEDGGGGFVRGGGGRRGGAEGRRFGAGRDGSALPGPEEVLRAELERLGGDLDEPHGELELERESECDGS